MRICAISLFLLSKQQISDILNRNFEVNMREALFQFYKNIVEKCVDIEWKDLISVDPPKDASFGDFSTNIAMILAKKLNRNPVEIAEEIANQLRNNENVERVEVKKPGFVNWFVPKKVLLAYLPQMCEKDYARINLGNGRKVNIEYVSANPTGPIHAGHTRGAVSGDVLAELLKFVGYDVTKEFYINDAGKQIEILAKSLHHRYMELFGKTKESLPNWAYPGAYLVDTAKKLAAKYGDKFVETAESEWLEIFKQFAIDDMLAMIKDDLHALGVQHDVFSSEKDLVRSGAVDRVLEMLKGKNLIYRGVLPKPKSNDSEEWEEREQLLFRSTEFGDDVDRPLQKSDGSWTYFASDIAYHMNKIERGFDEMIDFWGADHGGYVKRMKAAVSALSNGAKKLDVKLVQLVRLMEDGREAKMSKRAGTFITARDIIDKVGKDVVRFIMLTRRDDAALDFDFKKVVEQSKDNPVFYVQYAYARTHSVLKQFEKTFGKQDVRISEVNANLLSEECLPLLKTIADWPRQVVMAARNREPHRIAFFLADVAAAFHSLWNQGKENTVLRCVLPDDFDKTCANLALIKAMQNVIETAFSIMGITAIKELR
ncbi:MAG: arginine--tRNA ligase [Alphaproteobacteria bacterium]|nr:arginine--tRNA ligase [Alphaproteobacteria bacterium]